MRVESVRVDGPQRVERPRLVRCGGHVFFALDKRGAPLPGAAFGGELHCLLLVSQRRIARAA